MAIIIDIGKYLEGEKPVAVDTTGAAAPNQPAAAFVSAPEHTCIKDDGGTPNRRCIACEAERNVSIIREGFEACQHRSMQIDDKQRTVKCGTCGIWLDPVWCLRELFHYYQTRLDWRLAAIEEAEKKEAERRKRKEDRRQKPRAYKEASRKDKLERAAYNQYQATLLLIRAGDQVAAAQKLSAEIETMKAEEKS